MKKRNKILVLLFTIILLLSACGSKPAGEEQKPSSTQGEAAGGVEEEAPVQDGAGQTGADGGLDVEALKEQMGFYVDGGVLYDANGNSFVMRGINHAHTWFTDKLFVALDAIEDTGSNCVRIVLSNGEQWNENTADTVAGIIDACKERKLIAILEVHDATGYNDKESLLAAAQYFVDMKDVLIGEEAYVIINIANEWLGNSATQAWK